VKIDKEKFAKRFKQCKDITGLTQKEIAAILGVKRSTVGSWESAHRLPQVEKAQGLADIFKVRVGYLIGSEDDPTSPQAPIKKPTPDILVIITLQRDCRSAPPGTSRPTNWKRQL